MSDSSAPRRLRREELVSVGRQRLCVSRPTGGGGEPLLLIAGLGMQLAAWPPRLIDELEEVGFYVLSYDHRDVGRSSYAEEAGAPDLLRALRGDRSRLAYGLEELAEDALGVLDALAIPAAHLLGVSMGAMVAQVLTLQHPERVRSLTSVMGTTGARGVGESASEALGVLLRPPARSEEDAIEQRREQLRITRGPGEPIDDAVEAERALALYRRGHNPLGSARHLAAILSAEDRTAGLKGVDCPTLVIHGESDLLIDVSGGRATAAAIPDAELLVIPGMGHDLPDRHLHEIAEAVARNGARERPGGGGREPDRL